tara:strand:+ start:178 stop:348 length:171 start_codon:yes stop_codon:yes gene_type:complete
LVLHAFLPAVLPLWQALLLQLADQTVDPLEVLKVDPMEVLKVDPLEVLKVDPMEAL